MKLGISESRTKVRMADLENAFLDFLSSHSTTILRWAIAVVFIWFGALKLVPGVSPAEAIAGRTLQELSLGVLKPSLSLPLLALLEVTIGFGFLFGRRLKLTLWLLMGHMAGTLTPFVLFPHERDDVEFWRTDDAGPVHPEELRFDCRRAGVVRQSEGDCRTNWG